jgi:hypothetical protein
LFYAFFLFQKIDLTTADLGRHLKNGELLLKGETEFLKTNFYSYTYPDYAFVNHHWLSGVLFFLVFKIFGFSGLHLFFIILSIASFLIFFQTARKESGFKIAAIISLLLIPLIAYRREIRPELFTYLFSAVFFAILWRYRNKPIFWKSLFVLPIIEILWVNSHIYFFIGIAIFGAFILERALIWLKTKNQESRDKFKFLVIVFVLCIAATMASPFGLKGAIHPLAIYQNYGYRVFEEQSIWFLERLNVADPSFLLCKIVFILLALSFVLLLIKTRRNFPLVNLFLAIGLGLMAAIAVRNFTIFGLVALPIISLNVKRFFDTQKIDLATINTIIVISAIIIFVFNIINLNSKPNKYFSNLGLGLMPDNNASADFFKKENISGPIFNDYDIGGYLIYHFYPQEMVFTDNRPEVYPVEFFTDVYIPMQEQNEIWHEQDRNYQFNAIFFSHRDYTPWGQNFLIQRVNDKEWAPVFADQYNIIFLKRNEINKQIIQKYEIPKTNFRIR